tara:strand:- start:1230 stop:2372 length:1143 start_codon:yes stop_codon:yes gene_type:complete
LKILITVGIFPPDIGGPASFVPKIANLLVDSGYSVTVICLTEKHQFDNEKYKIVRILRKQNLIIRWIKTIFYILKHGLKSNLIFVNGLPMESYIANLVLRKKLYRKIVGDWAWERGMNRKLINESFDEFQKNKHSLHLEIAKFSRGWTATKAHLVITPSNHLKKIVSNWGVSDEKIKVIYNGTIIDSTQDLDSELTPDNLKFITVGRLAPWKNINIMLEAFSVYKKQNNRFTFYIVGSGPEEKTLKNLSKKLNLEKEVVFTGQLKKDALSECYQNSNIYIQGSSYEGLPHVILEAISHNLSIISTPIGGTNEVLLGGKNGWIWELRDSFKPQKRDLINIIEEMTDNVKKDILLKENAMNHLREFFNEEENLNSYKEILKK